MRRPLRSCRVPHSSDLLASDFIFWSLTPGKAFCNRAGRDRGNSPGLIGASRQPESNLAKISRLGELRHDSAKVTVALGSYTRWGQVRGWRIWAQQF